VGLVVLQAPWKESPCVTLHLVEWREELDQKSAEFCVPREGALAIQTCITELLDIAIQSAPGEEATDCIASGAIATVATDSSCSNYSYA
jgi:hypothetical protein